MFGYCGYCHDAATFFCPDETCEGGRKSVCKSCAMTNNCKCSECSSLMIEEDEL